jgi:hypothetical protein
MRRHAVPYLGAVCLVLLQACSGYRVTLTPTITVTEEFTDNVNASSDNPQSDFITSVSPGLAWSAKHPRRELSFSYNPSFAYYAETGTDFTIRQSAAMTALNHFDKHTIAEFSDTFSRTDDPFVSREIVFERTDDPAQPIDTTHRQNREPFYTNSALTTFRHGFGRDDSFFIRYLNSFLKNEDPTEEDSMQNAPSVGVTYWLTPNYGIETSAQYTRGDFSLGTSSFDQYQLNTRFIRRFTPNFDIFLSGIQSKMVFQGNEENFQVFDATVGVDYHLSRSTFFSLSTGYFFRVPDETSSQGGYVLRADMAREFSRGSVRISGGTGYRETFFGAENLGFTEFYEGTLAGAYSLTRHLSALGQAGYTHNSYKDTAGREDDILTFEAGLTYLIRPWLTSSLRFTHHELESTQAGDSFDENRVSLSLTFVPKTPWIFE